MELMKYSLFTVINNIKHILFYWEVNKSVSNILSLQFEN